MKANRCPKCEGKIRVTPQEDRIKCHCLDCGSFVEWNLPKSYVVEDEKARVRQLGEMEKQNEPN